MAITSDIQQQVFDLLSKASNLSFVSSDLESGTGIRLSPGQRVTAEVLTLLPDKRVQVQVGTQRFNLELPMAVRPGQNLEMTYVSGEPRSTFAIARPAGTAPPVSLSDASRLLGLLVGSERFIDPGLRSSLHNISELLRRTSGDSVVLANLMDEALTYGPLRQPGKLPGDQVPLPKTAQSPSLQSAAPALTPEQARLATFEANAAQILQKIAGNSRFLLAQAISQPVVPLPLMPGEEVDAAVLGTLPGKRAFVQIAGTSLELALPRTVQSGEILRLTYISSEPKPLFAIARTAPDISSAALSEAGRWLSVLEHNQGGVSSQQMFVLERLNTVLKSLPPDSPAFTAIKDEPITYQSVTQGRRPPTEQTTQGGAAMITVQQAALLPGNGIILNDDMAKLLQALIKGNRLALLETLNQQSMPTGLSLGQQLKGEVLAALGGGRFLLQVADQALEFSMPKGAKRGDMVNLFFISEEPAPTFLLARFGKPGDSRVSDTGRWLSGFLGGAARQVSVQEAMGVVRTLLTAPPADSAQVGRMLQQGLQESGLFYESHLTRWFGGEFPLEELLREPQGRLSHLKQAAVVPPPVAPHAEELARAGIKTGSIEIMDEMLKQAGTTRTQELVTDPRAMPVVQEQLKAMQDGQLVYRGDLFPGQKMEWSVTEREAQRKKDGSRERSWDTALQLDLPKLGAIRAKLTLDGNRVRVEIRAVGEAEVTFLDAGRPVLVEQLLAAGLVPGDIGVHHDTPRS
jgi:hypothetical protein